jgi:hypothetical protein
MNKRILIGSTLAVLLQGGLLAAPALAEDHVRTYNGTYSLDGGYSGVSGPISITVDRTTHTATATLNIPVLSPNFAPSPPVSMMQPGRWHSITIP